MAKRSTTSTKRPTKRGTNGTHSRETGGYEFGELIKDREVESVFGALAIGFCIGVMVGTTMSRPRVESWTDRVTAEGLGRRVMDTLEQILPNAISERFHS